MRIRTLLFAAAMLAASGACATAQTHYTPPQPVPLSADLASPWILQLRNKPSPDGRYAVEVARPLPPRHSQLRTGFNAFAVRGVAPRRAQGMAPAPRQKRNLQQASVQQPAQQPPRDIDPKFEIQTVSYEGTHKPGTIIIDTTQRFLFLVQGDGTARRYGIGVGREGFTWSGTEKISRKAEWPSWTPPKQMIAREAARGHYIPDFMEGGPKNPLGARALYLGDTLYRIHGTNQPWTIGKAVSSGCIRMRNEDVMDLYERVGVGTRVVVS